MDTGPICRQISCDVGEKETYGELYERLSRLNIEAMDLLLEDLHSDNLKFTPQQGKATYAPLISSKDAAIDWDWPAHRVERHIRAFCPDPGAYTFINSERVKIYRASVVKDAAPAGEVLKVTPENLHIACGEDAISIEEIQPAGARRMEVKSFLAGRLNIQEGENVISDELA